MRNHYLQNFVLDLATLYLFLGKDMSGKVFDLIKYSIDLISGRSFPAGILISSTIPLKHPFLRNFWVVPGQLCYP